MKNITLNLTFTKVLLTVSVITSCIIKNPTSISVSIIFLVIHSLVDRYLTIYNAHKINEDKFDSIDIAINNLETKVNHLTSKDAVSDMMKGIAPKR